MKYLRTAAITQNVRSRDQEAFKNKNAAISYNSFITSDDGTDNKPVQQATREFRILLLVVASTTRYGNNHNERDETRTQQTTRPCPCLLSVPYATRMSQRTTKQKRSVLLAAATVSTSHVTSSTAVVVRSWQEEAVTTGDVQPAGRFRRRSYGYTAEQVSPLNVQRQRLRNLLS